MIRDYDTFAHRYDRMHCRWLRHAGGEAQAALEASLVTRLSPGDRVLDAGCGTGALARSLALRFDGQLRLTLLDASRAMLDGADDPDATRVQGSLLDMPFADGQFAVAVAAWSIEATGDEWTAIGELMRVVRPGGHVLAAFCASDPGVGMAARLLRKGVELRRAGRFLDTAEIENAFRAHGASHLVRHRCTGPAAVIDARRGTAAQMARAA